MPDKYFCLRPWRGVNSEPTSDSTPGPQLATRRLTKAGLLAAPILLLALVSVWSFYCPDDLFIHLRFARNLAENGEWAFNPGEPVAGATSPPWVILLAGLHLVGLTGVVAAKLLAAACAVGVVVVVAALASRDTGVPSPVAALVVAGLHWLTLWTAAGMETALVPLLLLAGWACFGCRLPRPIVGASLLGFATWSRPDCWPAAAILLAFGLTTVSRGRRLIAAVAFAAAAISWPMVSRLVLGSWLPITTAAKGAQLAGFDLALKAVLRTGVLAASECLPLVVLAGAAALTDRAVRSSWRSWFPIAVAAATYPAGFAVNHALGGVEATGRYMAPWFVLVATSALIAVAPWWVSSRRRRWVVAAVCLAIAQSLTLGWLHRPPTLRYHEYHTRSLVEAGRWLAANADRENLVLAGDIGVIGYLGDVRILDPAGIINPAAPAWARDGRTWEEVAGLRPAYAINPAWRPGFDPGLLEPYTARVIFRHEHERYRWRRHPGRFTVTFRELDWTQARAAHTPRR